MANDLLNIGGDTASSPVSLALARFLNIIAYVCGGRLGHRQLRTLLCLRCRAYQPRTDRSRDAPSAA